MGRLARAAAVVAEKGPDLTAAEVAERAQQVGIGAIKYADLSTSLGRDYIFDLDRMVSLNGDTSVYLQYAFARTQSILRKAAGASPKAHADLRLEPNETLDEVIAAYQAECDRSREIAAQHSRDHAVTSPQGRELTWMYLHLILETGRHAGHVDIMREMIDGTVGD